MEDKGQTTTKDWWSLDYRIT